MNISNISRRDFLKSGGALVVSCAVPGAVTMALSQAPQTLEGKPPLMPEELDSWIAILPDGSVTAYFGKMDMGQGVDVAIGQIVAEELDVAFEQSQRGDGRHCLYVQPGRRLRQHRSPARRHDNEKGRGGSAPRAGRDGLETAGRARGSAHGGQRRCERSGIRAPASELRRARRRQVLPSQDGVEQDVR